MTTEVEKLPEGSVAQVMQVGYTINGRVIRPARVAVSKKPDTTQTE
jgi:molecular chaperone GrpE (heat shock protein)